MSALRRSFVFRDLSLALAALACGLSLGATSANAQSDPRWGLLAEIIEHDYQVVDYLVTVRWDVPDGAQTPWDSSSLIQPFYFAGK